MRLFDAVNLKTFYDDKSSVETPKLLAVSFAKVYHHAILYGSAKSKKEKEAINNQTNATELYEMNKNSHEVYVHYCNTGC